MSNLDLEEEIKILVSTETLYKNNKSWLFIWTLANTLTNDHVPNDLSDYFTNAESNGNESQTTAHLEIEKGQSDTPKDSLSVLGDKLDTLQKFFVTE